MKNNLSPIWEPFKVSLNSLCSCEEKRKLRVRKGDGDPIPGMGRLGGGHAPSRG